MESIESINTIKTRWVLLGIYCGEGRVYNDNVSFNSDVTEANFHLQSSETKRHIGAIYQHIKRCEDDRGLFLGEVIKDLENQFRYIHSKKRFGLNDADQQYVEFGSLLKEVIEFNKRVYNEVDYGFNFLDKALLFWEALDDGSFNWQVKNIDLSYLQSYDSDLDSSYSYSFSDVLLNFDWENIDSLSFIGMLAEIKANVRIPAKHLFGRPLANRNFDFVKPKLDKYYYQNIVKTNLGSLINYGFFTNNSANNVGGEIKPTIFLRILYDRKLNTFPSFNSLEVMFCDLDGITKNYCKITNTELNYKISDNIEQYLKVLIECETAFFTPSQFKSAHKLAESKSGIKLLMT